MYFGSCRRFFGRFFIPEKLRIAAGNGLVKVKKCPNCPCLYPYAMFTLTNLDIFLVERAFF
jgi:hypothetical protein